ncbi:hypothetical protein BH09PSE5_BH09PSE5_35800 [soil metagenome]
MQNLANPERDPSDPVSVVSIHDGVASICIDNPPINAINSAVRARLWHVLDAIENDPLIEAVVIGASGRMFSGGGDLRELGQPDPPGSPNLGALALRIERLAKPVVAMLFGKVIGGGVLLAMACHARVGMADAQLALPEVNLGFVPGAGGTQRLPRLVGLNAAVEMVSLAAPLTAADALAKGLLDAVADTKNQLAAMAADTARAIARGGRPWRRTFELQVPGGALAADLLSSLREGAARKFPDREAVHVAIDLLCLAAGTPFDQGAQEERAAYLRLASSPQTRQLLDAFFAERAAARKHKETAA